MIEIFNGVKIELSGSRLTTEGLINYIGNEVRITIGSRDLNEYAYVLKYIISYVIKDKPVISAEQTILFNSWMLHYRFFHGGVIG